MALADPAPGSIAQPDTAPPATEPVPAVVDVRVRESRSARWTMLAGIVFVATFVVGVLLTGDTPDYDASDQAWVDWYDDGGHRAQQITSMFLLAVAALAFAVFIHGLVRRLRSAHADRDGASQVALGAGMVFSGILAIAGVALNQMSGAIEFGDIPIPDADLLRTAEQLGFGLLLVAGGVFAALTVAAASLAARGTVALPGWLVTAGFVAAALLLLSVLFIPMVLLPLWVLVVALYAARHPITLLEVSSSTADPLP